MPSSKQDGIFFEISFLKNQKYMLKRIFFLGVILIAGLTLQAQTNAVLKGLVKDATTGEQIIGASITYAPGKGVTTDVNGSYKLEIASGEYTITVSFVGYEPNTRNVIVKPGNNTIDFGIEVKTLKEVEITVDRAKERETPVAFSTVTAQQIKEELGPRDIPMLLTSTPGVYATQGGGGRGDSRINIRGFDQKNLSIMVDGIPMNDLENGQMYWSDFDGLGDATRSIQIQRGLGASRLAIPSLGGTINILTRGIESQRSGTFRQEIGSDGYEKTYLSYNSGAIKEKLGFTLGASHITGHSYTEASNYTTWSYFGKVQYKLGRHLLSLAANGAPQMHQQRFANAAIAVWDKKYAEKLGVTPKQADSALKASGFGQPLSDGTYGDRGLRYNMHWGYLTRNGKTDKFNEELNYYNKPLINLTDNWKISEKVSFSNVLYYSFGQGAGTYFPNQPGRIQETGQYNLQSVYDAQSSDISIDRKYDPSLHKSTTFVQSLHNDHKWLGLLSNIKWDISNNLTFSGGMDARGYKARHYETVYDLMGGDYYVDASNLNGPLSQYNAKTRAYNNAWSVMKKQGDMFGYNNDGLVRWLGFNGQLEYKTDKFSVFFTASAQRTAYNRIDYYSQKDLIINGKTFTRAVGAGDTMLYDGNKTITYNGNNRVYLKRRGDTTFFGKNYVVNPKSYNNSSSEAHFNTSNWIYFTTYTLKGGANYNINSYYNVFFNTGYLSIPPKFSNVLDNGGHIFTDAKSQVVKSVELGFGGHYDRIAFNINGYYTGRENIPYLLPVVVNNITYTTSVNGISALHKGIEFDGNYSLLENLKVDAFFAIGDWQYTSQSKAFVYDPNGKIIDSFLFSAKGVHVSDAAQTQIGGGFRYNFFKGFYIKPRWTYYARQWARFDPGTLALDFKAKTDARGRDSWQLPSYSFADIFFGYDTHYKKVKITFNGGVTNVFNVEYIADGVNGGGFNASTALVWFGAQRRYQFGLAIHF
jgi:iron complex outermembrane receptor protein